MDLWRSGGWRKLPKGWTKASFRASDKAQQTDAGLKRRAKRRDALTTLVWKTTSTGIYFKRRLK